MSQRFCGKCGFPADPVVGSCTECGHEFEEPIRTQTVKERIQILVDRTFPTVSDNPRDREQLRLRVSALICEVIREERKRERRVARQEEVT